MAKYIDADLLRKDIEFAKSIYSNPQRVVHGVADAYRQDGRAAMCDDILKKIGSLQQEQPEELDKDLEETAKEYATTHLRNNEFPTADSAFIAGSLWKEEQMMKEAVDGTVHHYSGLVHYVNTDEVQLTKRLKQFNDCDKVKVIVIKED